MISSGEVDESAAVALASEICRSLGFADLRRWGALRLFGHRGDRLLPPARARPCRPWSDPATWRSPRPAAVGESVRVYSPSAALDVTERLGLLADFRLAVEDPAHAGELTHELPATGEPDRRGAGRRRVAAALASPSPRPGQPGVAATGCRAQRGHGTADHTGDPRCRAAGGGVGVAGPDGSYVGQREHARPARRAARRPCRSGRSTTPGSTRAC